MKSIQKKYIEGVFFSILLGCCSQLISLAVTYKIDSFWDSGAQIEINIKNNSSTATEQWQVDFDLMPGQTLNSIWNGIEQVTDGHVIVKNSEWAGIIPPGRSTSIGLILGGKPPFGISNLMGSSAKSTLPVKITETNIPVKTGETKKIKEEIKTKTEVKKSEIERTKDAIDGSIEEKKEEKSGKEIKEVAAITGSTSKKIVGYYTAWSIYDRDKPAFMAGNWARNIPAQLLTHINYAFLNLDASGNLIFHDESADTGKDWHPDPSAIGKGNIGQLMDLKKINPNLRILISIGGWTLSGPFSVLAASETARKNFAKNAVDFCKKWGFDGFDIDWEFPGLAEHAGRPVDRENFTKLLQDCYAAARANGLLLTIAAPAGPDNMANIDIGRIHNYVDWINVMTYDFHGPWKGPQDLVTNHNAPLHPTLQGDPKYNVQSAISAYLKQGVPAEKLVLGLPFYGRSFEQADSTPDGLFSRYSDPAAGTFDSEKGMRLYADIRDNLLSKPEWKYYWDSASKVPYLHNIKSKDFITFDDAKSIAAKAEYVKASNLGGVMIWEIRQNVSDLLSVINKVLRNK